MIKIVIFYQSKPIADFENRKIKNVEFVNCTFIIHKNENKTSIQHIIKSNSTSFMFNNIFGWDGLLQYILGYPSILLGYPSNIHTFMPSIGS